jgi:chromosome segregation ATPase
MNRLEANEKRINDYSKLVITRIEEREHGEALPDRTEAVRLEDELDRSRREAERNRKELESRRVEMDVLERESANYQLEISALKAKLKESKFGQE